MLLRNLVPKEPEGRERLSSLLMISWAVPAAELVQLEVSERFSVLELYGQFPQDSPEVVDGVSLGSVFV
jgi:hypothetical protein